MWRRIRRARFKKMLGAWPGELKLTGYRYRIYSYKDLDWIVAGDTSHPFKGASVVLQKGQWTVGFGDCNRKPEPQDSMEDAIERANDLIRDGHGSMRSDLGRKYIATHPIRGGEIDTRNPLHRWASNRDGGDWVVGSLVVIGFAFIIAVITLKICGNSPSAQIERCQKTCGYLPEAVVDLCVEEDWSGDIMNNLCFMPEKRRQIEEIIRGSKGLPAGSQGDEADTGDLPGTGTSRAAGVPEN